MYENTIESIRKAQEGNKEELSKIIESNSRAYLEYSKKIFWQRI